MTQFHEWEMCNGQVAPTEGRIALWCEGMTRAQAKKTEAMPAQSIIWSDAVIAFRRVKEPVRGEVVLGWDGLIACKDVHKRDTHRLTLTTDDDALICGEYVEPGGATIKVELRQPDWRL